MSKVDPGLVEALKEDSILASFFDNDLTVDILEPLFKLRNNSDVANFIEMVISKRQGTIRKVFPGKDAIKDFINAYKNGVVNYAYQNYLTNFIDSDGNVTDMPDVYRNLPITKTKGLVNGVEVTNEGIKVDMARLEKDYNLKLYENTSLAADRYNSPERNLRGFTPESNLFPTKSGFFRFNVEREFLRNKFPKESLLKNKDYLHYKTIISRSIKDDTKASNAAYEAYLNQRALLNTFNRNAIMNNTDYSYSQKVMDIINEFPHLKVRYPILNQLAIPNVKSGEKVLTLNNKLSVKGELAESYHQNLLDLANPNIIKVKSTKDGDTEDNKRVSELFKALPQIMIYQHGIGNSKYGFNNVLPYEIYLSIMRNASGLFINKNLNTRTFEDIYDKLMKTNNDKKIFFKDYISPVNEVANTYDYSSEEDVDLVQPVISDNGTTMSFGVKPVEPSTSVEYNYNPSNVSEQTREDYKQYVLKQLGKPEIKPKANAFDFIYPDLTITISKDGSVSYTNVNQKIVDLSKTNSGYDIKFMVGLNKLAEESAQPTQPSTTEVKEGVLELFESNPELASVGTPQQYSQYLDTVFPNSKVKDILYHGGDLSNIVSRELPTFFTKDINYASLFTGVSATSDEKRIRIKGATYAIDSIEELGDEKYEVTTKNNKKFIVGKFAEYYTVDPIHGFESSKKPITEYNKQRKTTSSVFKAIVNVINPAYVNENSFENFKSIKEKLTENDSIIGEETIDTVKRGANKFTAEGESIGVFSPEQIHILGNKQDIEGFKNFVSGFNQENVSSINTIVDFYNELTEEQKKKIGTLEDLNDQYNEIPFQMTEEEFINNIKCNL